MVSERGRISLRYEHPGRANEYTFWFDADLCRLPGGTTTSIGYDDDDWIPSYEIEIAEPAPSNMRPALRYSVMFPHDVFTGLPMAEIQPLVYAVINRPHQLPDAEPSEVSAVEQPKGTKSKDLNEDIKKMWATKRLGKLETFASTDSAIAAADRVFNTAILVGKTREDIIDLLGDPRTSNNSQYNFSFWPAPKTALVYRFDCGSYGWQFNIIFDRQAKVKKVDRQWIH